MIKLTILFSVIVVTLTIRDIAKQSKRAMEEQDKNGFQTEKRL